MVLEPVLAGDIPAEGVVALLREIEQRRTSGVLRATGADGATHEIVLVAGQIALDQPETETDPIEGILALRSGRYEVFQRLPPLGVSHGDDLVRTGSLSVHVPADLMAYCERAGLTGLLVLERDGQRAEAAYDRGELLAIRLDGRDDDTLGEVFAWEAGTFTIEAQVETPEIAVDPASVPPGREVDASEAAPARQDDTGMRFLRVVEVTLASIVEEREKRRSPTRTSPGLPPAPRSRPPSLPAPPPEPPRRSRPDTVKVIYLRADAAVDPGASSGSRHVRTDVPADTGLPDARPDRVSRPRAATPIPHLTTPATRVRGSAPERGQWVLWVVTALLVGLAFVALRYLW